MPTHFGPSLGPRQGLDGRRYDCLETSRDLSIQATFQARASELEKLLPPGFSLREPNVISLSFTYSKDIEWLAWRGYNTLGVSVPATYRGRQDTVNGDLLLVLWENMADPIITGREDLGFSKVYCELPEPQFIGDEVICRASWDGCQFASLKLTGLKEVSAQELPEVAPSDGILHYKYIPKTSAPGIADVEYPLLTPADWPNVVVDKTMLAGSATGHFRQSTWEELPTLVHIVNALSELTLGDCIEATLMKSHGGKDLSDQRILG
jgi:hypothetical protein